MLSSPFCTHSDLASPGRQPSNSGARVFFLKHLTGAVLVELPPRVMKNPLFGSWAEKSFDTGSVGEIALYHFLLGDLRPSMIQNKSLVLFCTAAKFKVVSCGKSYLLTQGKVINIIYIFQSKN